MSAPSSAGHPDHGDLPPATTVEVADHVYAYVQPDGSWWINNTGFVVGEGSVTAIDSSSTEKRTRAFRAAIGAVSPDPVRTLVNTHHHGDHTNGNCLFPDATIVASRECRAGVRENRIGGLEAVFGSVDWGDLRVAPPTLTFDDHIDLHVDDVHIELHHVGGPAHTTGDIVAWLPGERVLFAGDLVFNGGTPFVLMGSVSGSLAAIGRLRRFEAEVIVPGHGGVCGPGALDEVERYLRFVEHVAAEGRAAGLGPLATARSVDLGAFAGWLDPERIVGNLHRAGAELDGRPPGGPIDLVAAFGDMVAYNGGRPLRCMA